MKTKVLTTARAFGIISREPAEMLETAGFEVTVRNDNFDQAEFESIAPEYDAIILGGNPFPEHVLEKCSRLKMISKFGVGMNNVPLEKCKEMGIVVTNTPGLNANAVADLTFGLILSACRNLVLSNNNVRKGLWRTEIGIDVYKKTLGVIGYGAIAKDVIRRAKGFDMKVLVYNHRPKEMDEDFCGYARFVDLDELLAGSDIVTLHVPLANNTRNMIDAPQIAAMKDGAILVNTSRGGIVNERALYEACKSGKLRAAALDVLEKEPAASDNPLLSLPNVIITSHIGMFSEESINAVNIRCAENVIAMFKGGTVKNRVV